MALKDMVSTVERGKNGRSILLEGPSGCGKTHAARSLMAGAPELGMPGYRVLIASTERKLTTLEDLNLDNVVTIEHFMYPHPSDASEAAAAIANPMKNMYQLLHALRTEEHEYEVLFIDSGMRFMTRLLWEITRTNPNPDRRSDYALLKHKALNFLDHLATLTDSTVVRRPMHVVMTWGVEPEQDALMEGGKKLMPSMDGQKVAPVVAYYFDDVLMLRTRLAGDGVEYVAMPQAQPTFDAKVSSPVKLPATIINPNLYRIIKILRGELLITEKGVVKPSSPLPATAKP